jgi:hypothetical protein
LIDDLTILPLVFGFMIDAINMQTDARSPRFQDNHEIENCQYCIFCRNAVCLWGR